MQNLLYKIIDYIVPLRVENPRPIGRIPEPDDWPSIYEGLRLISGLFLLMIALALVPIVDKLVHNNLNNGLILLLVIPPYIFLLVVVVLMTRQEHSPFIYSMWSLLICAIIVLYFLVPKFSNFQMVVFIVAPLLPIPCIVVIIICNYMGVVC